jgi:hypothetical protein
VIEDDRWLPCGMCGWTTGDDSCTCIGWLDPVIRRRMERDVLVRHRASVALAMSHVVIGRAA